jgi:hypothetical protein
MKMPAVTAADTRCGPVKIWSKTSVRPASHNVLRRIVIGSFWLLKLKSGQPCFAASKIQRLEFHRITKYSKHDQIFTKLFGVCRRFADRLQRCLHAVSVCRFVPCYLHSFGVVFDAQLKAFSASCPQSLLGNQANFAHLSGIAGGHSGQHRFGAFTDCSGLKK